MTDTARTRKKAVHSALRLNTGYRPGDIAIWQPIMGSEYWTVKVIKNNGCFLTVSPTKHGNPDNTRPGTYIARIEELHDPKSFTPAPPRFCSPMETAFARQEAS